MSEVENNSPENNEQGQQEQQAQQQQPKAGALKHYKEELEKTRKANEELAKQLEEIKVNQMREKSNFKDLYELETTKRQEAEEKLKNLSSSFVDNLMRKEIEAEAMALGLRQEALADLELIDKSMVEVETTSTGKINFNNVKEYVELLKTTRPHWFKSNEMAKINNALPSNPQFKELTAAQVIEMQKKDPAKYNEYMIKRLKNRI